MKHSLFFALTVILLLTGVDLHAQPYGDYTLYCPQNSSKGYLLDLSGNYYHTWTFASNAKTGYSSYLLPGRILLRTVARSGNYFTGGPVCGQVQKVDWDGNVIWNYVYSTQEYCTHHDICPMPNGNVLLIAYESKTPAQVTQAGSSISITMWPDKIVEIEPVGTSGGNVVWEWHSWDHLCQNVNPAKDNYVTSIVQHPELLNINYLTSKDWQHVNGIDYNAGLDQITFSSHNFNEIYVIDHSTTTAEAAGHTGGNSGKGGDILYRWGNPSAYQASGTTIFNVVHDAHWVPSDCPHGGYLAAFNNRGGTGNKSCVDLIIPPLTGFIYNIVPGSAFAPPTYAWRHIYSGNPTNNEGNAQQLPNGNTLICISQSRYIYEIDSNQNVVWSKTVSTSASQAFRYTACYVNGVATPVISQSGHMLISSSASGNQWYLNGDSIPGATAQQYYPTENGSYQVRVNDGNGCFSALSDPYDYSTVGINETEGKALMVYPNPTNGRVSWSGSFLDQGHFKVTLLNVTGSVVYQASDIRSADLGAHPEGLYYLKITTAPGGVYIRKIVLTK